MITTETVRDLARLIDALSDAADQLENAYLRKDFATVEKIVVFLGSERGVVKEGEVKIERCEKTYQDLDKYGLDMYTETTKSEWDKVGNYLTGVAKFWEDIK